MIKCWKIQREKIEFEEIITRSEILRKIEKNNKIFEVMYIIYDLICKATFYNQYLIKINTNDVLLIFLNF